MLKVEGKKGRNTKEKVIIGKIEVKLKLKVLNKFKAVQLE
jgi:hypothetical protein